MLINAIIMAQFDFAVKRAKGTSEYGE